MPLGPDLVPELAVRDLQASLRFWCDLIGFRIRNERPEERFAYLVLGRAHIMLDQIGHTRTWETGDLRYPLGRGINFEVQVPDVDTVLERLNKASWPIFLPIEERWYRAGDEEIGVRQFLVMDPDGYLLRPQVELGTRPVDPSARR